MRKQHYMFVVDNQKGKRKNFIVLLFFLVIAIVVGSCLGVKYAKEHINRQDLDDRPKASKKADDTNNIEEIITTPIEQPEVKKNKLPIVTDLGRENVKSVYSSTQDNKRVFLTFDDGPSSNITPLILDLLKENDIKVTFFTLGSRVVQNPEIVKREYEEGHYIANHGYSHIYSSIYSSADSLLDEYNRTEDAIRNAIEVPEYSSHLFRFPGGSVGGKYGLVKKEYAKLLEEQGVFYVDWNCLNEDSSGSRTKEQLVGFIKQYSENKNSVVVLMHDAGDKILTYETLQEVIDYFRENGYTFCNFYDVIEYELR